MTDNRLVPFFTTLAGVASLFFSLCTVQAADTKQTNEDKPVAVVNGAVLTSQDLNALARAVSASRGNHQLPREEALNTLIDRELLFQDAVAKGLDKRPDVIHEIANQRQALLANVDVNEVLHSQPVTEQELHKVFEERVLPSLKGNEFKARHILVKTEGEAKDIISQLDKGADFSALAKSKSIDTGSAVKGGDLGWFSPKQMVPEFSRAAAALAKGKYTEVPIKTQFGWHVILLDDSRPITPPKFDDVKGQLEGLVENQRLSEYVSALRKKAKIETK
jgi:peptidyl-prolyl cis-trans isomerase C